MCILIHRQKLLRKKVTSKFKTKLPHIHKNPSDTHSHKQKKNNC